ncbi:neuronal acetylcholine receptor subunit beta-3-like [Mya arenaria]|uniref:neuronal acetylcholine receptor subunit beta-3-like n=1 Tax=Mya arenaria TaxID=6604 RepID=UPI0022DEBF19|nr:neuronal acetylcholine receptor subunit beta-3-like [Mya arenaria]
MYRNRGFVQRLVYCQLFLFYHFVTVESQSTHTQHVKELKVAFNGYDPENRPDVNMNVTVTFSVTSISDVDIDTGQITVAGTFIMTWSDPLFQWDSAVKTPPIEYVFYRKSSIWTPVLVVDSAIDHVTLLGDEYEMLRVGNDAVIQWEPAVVSRTHCDVIMTGAIPDYLQCRLRLSSWTYSDSEVKLMHHSTSISTAHLQMDSQTSIGSSGAGSVTVNDPRGEFSKTYLSYTMEIKLNKEIFTLSWHIVLTYVILTCAHLLVFVTPTDHVNQPGFSATILMASAVYLALIYTYVSSILPSTTRLVSHLELHMFAHFILIILESIAGTFIHRLRRRHNSGVPVPSSSQKFARSVLAKLSFQCCCYGDETLGSFDFDLEDEETPRERPKQLSPRRSQMPLRTRVSPTALSLAKGGERDGRDPGFYRIKSASSTTSNNSSNGDSLSSPSTISSPNSESELTRRFLRYTWMDIASMWSRVLFFMFATIRLVLVIVSFLVVYVSCDKSFCLK